MPFSGGFSILILLALVNSSLQERIETISAALQGHMDDEEAEEEPSSGYRPPLECEPFPLNRRYPCQRPARNHGNNWPNPGFPWNSLIWECIARILGFNPPFQALKCPKWLGCSDASWGLQGYKFDLPGTTGGWWGRRGLWRKWSCLMTRWKSRHYFDLQESPKTGRITVLLGKDAQELRVVQAWVCAQSLSFNLWRHVAGYCFDASWPMGRSLAGSWSQFRCLPRSSLLIIDSTFLFQVILLQILCVISLFSADLAAARSLRLSSLSPIWWSNCGVCHTGVGFFSTWPLRLFQPSTLKNGSKVQGLILVNSVQSISQEEEEA